MIIINQNNTTPRRISIRKALRYSGCSKNIYYGNKGNRYAIATAVTAVTAATPSTTRTEQEIQKISLQRPTYGTRRMAAMLTRVLGIPVNRKKA
ncbi:MAG: hypothetical protein MRJ93_05875 [Nitrososphaeraceae archaeon]|nr:hypothetical protein [Nitrososphaeraceae archaeon]